MKAICSVVIYAQLMKTIIAQETPIIRTTIWVTWWSTCVTIAEVRKYNLTFVVLVHDMEHYGFKMHVLINFISDVTRLFYTLTLYHIVPHVLYEVYRQRWYTHPCEVLFANELGILRCTTLTISKSIIGWRAFVLYIEM